MFFSQLEIHVPNFFEAFCISAILFSCNFCSKLESLLKVKQRLSVFARLAVYESENPIQILFDYLELFQTGSYLLCFGAQFQGILIIAQEKVIFGRLNEGFDVKE